MATQRIAHGATIETATPSEVAEIVNAVRQPERKLRVRAAATVQLNAAGVGEDDVYKVPLGMEFAVRRVFLNITGASDPSTGNVPLNVAGKYVAYLRSGALIEYAVPISPNVAPQVPGTQTWGDQQGPYLRNGEVFQVVTLGLTANAVLDVQIEGILSKPEPWEDR